MSARELPLTETVPSTIGARSSSRGLRSGASTWAARLVIACITAYQKYLSPRKGWSCAHRVRHGGSSCSQFVKQAIATHGIQGAVPLSQQRFAACKAASLQMRAERLAKHGALQSGPKRKGEGWFSGCENCSAPCDVLDGIFDCGPSDSGCIDCGSCDFNCSS